MKNAPVTAPTTKVARTRKAIFHRLKPFIVTTNKVESPPKAIFFDAAGTLFYLPRGVGYHYALVARELGLKWDSHELDRAFQNAWNAMPPRAAIDGPRENDDKDWWRQLVDPEVVEVLENLHPRFQLAVISNFDGRLRMILEQLGVSKFFRHVFVSSELGADKPNPEIFRRALRVIELQPNQVLHVGDDPERDWDAATSVGLSIFQLDRKKNSLRDLLKVV